MVLMQVSRDELTGLIAVGLAEHPSMLPRSVRILDEQTARLTAGLLTSAIADARLSDKPSTVDLDEIVGRAAAAAAALRRDP